MDLTNAKGKPSHWSYNPISADAGILIGKNGQKPKMAPIRESDDDPSGGSNWQGVSYQDPVQKDNKNISKNNSENGEISPNRSKNVTKSDKEEEYDDEVIETDL